MTGTLFNTYYTAHPQNQTVVDDALTALGDLRNNETHFFMSRTKGSKNKPKVTNDFATKIAEKQESIVSLTNEVTSVTANIDTLKADLKEKKAALKKIEKEVATLEARKAKADAKAAEEKKMAEAASVLKKLLAEGMCADEILEKLK